MEGGFGSSSRREREVWKEGEGEGEAAFFVGAELEEMSVGTGDG
jgi:hypothetical protein